MRPKRLKVQEHDVTDRVAQVADLWNNVERVSL